MKIRHIIRFSCDNIIMRKKSFFCVVFMISISFFLIGMFLANYLYAIRHIEDIENHVGSDLEHLHVMRSIYFADKPEYYSDYGEFISQLKSLEGIQTVGWIGNSTVAFEQLLNNPAYYKLNANEGLMLGSMNMGGYSNLYQISDIDFLNTTKVEIELEEEFKIREDGAFPILVGDKYRNVLAVGDILTRKEMINKKTLLYYVVGYIKRDSAILPAAGMYDGANTVIMNDSFLTLLTDDEKLYGGMKMADTTYWLAQEGASLPGLKDKIEQLAKTYKYSVKSHSIKQVCNNLLKAEKENNRTLRIMIAFSLIICSISIISTMGIMIISRHRDISVMWANGVTKKEYFMILIVENVIKIISGLFVFVLGYYWLINYAYERGMKEIYWSLVPRIVGFLSMIGVVLLITTTSIPIMMLAKKTINQLRK